MRAIAALFIAALPGSAWAQVTPAVSAGIGLSAGAAWHDRYPDGADPVAAARAWLGVRLDDFAAGATGQFAWTREESGDEEFPGAWAVHFLSLSLYLEFDVDRVAFQAGV